MTGISEAWQFMSDRHDDGRSSAGEYRLKLSAESGEIARVYFKKKSDAVVAFEKLSELRKQGESISLERRRDLHRPYQWDGIQAS